ncbi:hypothetical protein [Nocardioides nanhaiensis]|uniref:Uncharacterized protein n=1 Tax=Nocardioides nanhaiensis TaxID=1476871 RepID=A0ABP8W6C6_9ACTN
MNYTAPLAKGDTIRDHRNRPVVVGAVRPLRADGRTWGVYAADGALVVRVAGVAR